MVSLRNDHLVNENKKQNISLCRVLQGKIKFYQFGILSTPNIDLNINNNMTNKKMIKN